MGSNTQVGIILLAFVIFTTMKGNLRKYLQVVGVA